jgi:hypothetical protein
MKRGAVLIGILNPYGNRDMLPTYAEAGVTALAMELVRASPARSPWTCCPVRPIWRDTGRWWMRRRSCLSSVAHRLLLAPLHSMRHPLFPPCSMDLHGRLLGRQLGEEPF